MNNLHGSRRTVLRAIVVCGVAGSLVACGVLPAQQSGASVYTDGSDLAIKVYEALKRNATTSQLNVDISSVGDEIILKGKVPNRNDVSSLEIVAGNVPGVRIVLAQVYTDN